MAGAMVMRRVAVTAGEAVADTTTVRLTPAMAGRTAAATAGEHADGVLVRPQWRQAFFALAHP
jgi:hypothetical protein